MWMDGMEDVFAVVWDSEEKTIKDIQVGYFGADGRNLMGVNWEIDATDETKKAVLKWLKGEAVKAFEESVIAYKNGIRKGSHVEVIRGRKVKIGTPLEVFWIGERPTYRSLQYDWMHETETVAGCYDANHNKVWIKAEYLKPTDIIKSPSAEERDKFIKAWVADNARSYNIYCR